MASALQMGMVNSCGDLVQTLTRFDVGPGKSLANRICGPEAEVKILLLPVDIRVRWSRTNRTYSS